MKEIGKIGIVLIGLVVAILAFFSNGNNPTITQDNDTAASLNYLPTQFLGNQIIEHNYFALSYSEQHKNAEWVAYQLKGSRLDLENAVSRDHFHFASEPAIKDQIKGTDYKASGYDRGHLAPAHDMDFNRLAMKECFYMSNICPQAPYFNRGIWKKLESRTRKWAKENKKIFVITGPLLKKDISKAKRLKNKADLPTIPSGYYKIILDYEGEEKKGIAFLFKNKRIDQPLERFIVSIDRVESYTNIDFFPDLSPQEQEKLEATTNPKLWGF